MREKHKMQTIVNLAIGTLIVIALSIGVTLTTDKSEAEIISKKLSEEAGTFQLERRITFYNGITGTNIKVIEGKCQVDHGTRLTVLCKDKDNMFKKHYLGLSERITYYVEQLEGSAAK